MTQQEHLTTEQLSAFLDKQLTPQEQAFFDAHLQSCQRCQNALAELRRTVVLLHAMPQPPLPRSFTLPASAGVSHTQQAARPQPQPVVRQGRISHYALRRTMRAVSTLAAAVAVIFILSGLLANVHFAGGGASTAGTGGTFSASSGPVHSPAAVEPNATGGAQTQGSTPKAAGSPIMGNHHSGTPTASSVTTPTPAPNSTPTQGSSNSTGATGPPTLPPALDPGQPAGRLTLGALLLLLSIAGLVATRRRRRNTAS